MTQQVSLGTAGGTGRCAGWRIKTAAWCVLALAALGAYGWGLARFIDAIPTAVADPDTPVDAIVVLTGGSQRVHAGFALLAQDKGRFLLVSGVSPRASPAALDGAQMVPRARLACCVTLGLEASDTIGNAAEASRWMAARGLTSVRLVTANYHMPRSLLEFRRALPPGARILPYPVFPEAGHFAQWWRWPRMASLVIGEYTKYLGAELRWTIARVAGETHAGASVGAPQGTPHGIPS